ncbi:MAG: 4-(cytidine 5'-diphospho)-2-C-methyl-D-erythritol kinase [Ferruginibacter sp.]
MIVFPNCKINLGLSVQNKRSDGFHNLATVFYPIPLKDAIELIKTPQISGSSIQFSQSGLSIPGDLSSNLCIKAYNLLQNDFPELSSVQLHLHKVIPMGAGLGGGSADAAFTLQLLNKVLQLQLTEEKLADYALQLGSDCPFFLYNMPCLATGRGEILKPLSIDLTGYQFILLHPGINVHTGMAFSALNRTENYVSNEILDSIIAQPIETWKAQLHNDFEEPVFQMHPNIAQMKQMLYSMGALYASMSGSGSTVFGIFPKGYQVQVEETSGYFVYTCTL